MDAERDADELKLHAVGLWDHYHAEPHLIDAARAMIAAHGRCRAVSTYLDWSSDRWPSDVPGALAKVEDLDLDRAFIAVGSADMHARIAELAAART